MKSKSFFFRWKKKIPILRIATDDDSSNAAGNKKIKN
jgi:hypothetical protein